MISSTRPGLLKSAFDLSSDPAYWDWVAGIGFPLDDASPYAGCKAILGGTALRVQNGSARLVDYVLPDHGRHPEKRNYRVPEETVRREYIRAVGEVRNHPDAVFRLSSGKDSRMIAASMQAAGVYCKAITSGYQEREIARRIAEIAGLDFEVARDTFPAPDRIDPVDWAIETLHLSDGLIPHQAHKAFNPRDYLRERPSATVVGHSELIKGGYVKRKMKLTHEQAAAQLEKEVIKDLPVRKAEITEQFRARMDYGQYTYPEDILFFPYVDTRASRYLEPEYLLYSRFTLPIFPPNDERVYMAISDVHRERRTNERMMFDLIEQNSPRMVRVPLVRHPWKYAPSEELEVIEMARNDDGGMNPYYTAKMADRMRAYIQASPTATDIATRSLLPEILAAIGLQDGPAAEINRNMYRKTLMRLFFIAVACENWAAM